MIFPFVVLTNAPALALFFIPPDCAAATVGSG